MHPGWTLCKRYQGVMRRMESTFYIKTSAASQNWLKNHDQRIDILKKRWSKNLNLFFAMHGMVAYMSWNFPSNKNA